MHSLDHFLVGWCLSIVDNKRPLERSQMPTFPVRPLVLNWQSLLHVMVSLLVNETREALGERY